MGGTLANVFKGGADATTGDKIAGGAIQSGLSGLSKATTGPQAPMGPGMVPSAGPAPAQVDPSFFAPTNFGRNPNAFYGGQ